MDDPITVERTSPGPVPASVKAPIVDRFDPETANPPSAYFVLYREGEAKEDKGRWRMVGQTYVAHDLDELLVRVFDRHPETAKASRVTFILADQGESFEPKWGPS